MMIEDIGQLDGEVDIKAFRHFCRGHVLIMFPAFEVQVSVTFIATSFMIEMC